MRDIKFRLFGKNSEEFLGVAPYGLSLNELQNVCDLDAWHIMQFTGLIDKNGTEIYEGDIFYDGIEHCLIKWCDSSASFVVFDGCENHELGNYLVNEVVIGNIHQNPELLKDES